MLFPKTQSLSNLYFTKEFRGYEIESKWRLLTENPVPTILRVMNDVRAGAWKDFSVSKTMGILPTGFRYLQLPFDFWAVSDDGVMRQVAMVAQAPWHNVFLVAFKGGQPTLFSNIGIPIVNPPLLRKEERKGDWVSSLKAERRILTRFPSARKIAHIVRERASVYITCGRTSRNFCISADLCYYKNATLSQIEVEYKGRNGLWIPDETGQFILRDFSFIHEILLGRYGGIILPTTKTKFEWIAEN